MIKITMLATLLAFSACAPAKTLKDFFADHPSLYENIYTRQAVKEQAEGIASSDAMDEDIPIEELAKKQKQLLRENGYNYAHLALRNLVTFCDEEEIAKVHRLRAAECRIIAAESNK